MNANHPDALYQHLFPYYAEICALSEIRKKPGIGVPLQSGIGGHSLLYLNGVCRDREAGYPTLKLCEPNNAASQGVGISVNSHYRNANWVAADGPDFLWRGALAPGEALTLESYERTQRQAKALGLLDGVKFQEHFFSDKPAGMTDHDFMYEISVATDYAARFGRDIYRTRVPLDRTRMEAIVAYLNSLNVPYRDSVKTFEWSVFNNNCVHVAQNALAEAGILAPWPTGQFKPIAAFKFPVPKNAFVDLAMRTNDMPIGDSDRLYKDEAARRALLKYGTLPTAPGGLAIAEPAIRPNDIYDIEKLWLIFFDNPMWGPYRPRFKRILREKRYLDLHENLCHFETLFASLPRQHHVARHPHKKPDEREKFQILYERYIARETNRISELRAAMKHFSQTQLKELT